MPVEGAESLGGVSEVTGDAGVAFEDPLQPPKQAQVSARYRQLIVDFETMGSLAEQP
jgi:hypothetical protein